MKKFFVIPLALCLALGLSSCGKGAGETADTNEADTSMLTGVEAVSEDGSVSILLPDETFMTVSSSGTAMDFQSEEEGYISVVSGEDFEEESLYDIMPETEDEVLDLFEGIDAEFEVRDFSFNEDEDGVKSYSSAVSVNNYVEDEESEPENFILLENLTADGDIYYYATAEIYDEALIEKLAASLATFGPTA
ncbi:MAG: hypothetical protein LUD81_02110 [Clostridiales bacterium]|nr:hypothetical protein [Clostridiales bacterium]